MDVAVCSHVAQYAVQEDALPTSSDFICAIECEENLQHFYTDLIEGEFPDSDTEILVNPQYFPDTKVGDTIGLAYMRYNDERASTAYATFTVCGMIQSRTDTQMHIVMRYSDTLEEKYGFSDQYRNVYFKFQNSINLTGKYDTLVNKTLAVYKLPEQEVYGVLNQAYLQSSIRETLDPASVFLILFSTAVVFLCSFLLIYNVYSIALTQDMQAFGLLHVIGMTHKQLRQLIIVQSLILLFVTLPVGLLTGYCIGWKMLSPLLFSSLAYSNVPFAFNLWIPLATILLTGFTLLWSATRPLHKLKSLTPIARVKFHNVNLDIHLAADLPKRYVRNKNYVQKNITPNARRMAKYTISRNQKKTVITALSMSLSVILFVLIATLCDYLIAYTETGMQVSDYIIKLEHTYCMEGGTEETTMTYPADGGVGFGEDYIAAVENSVYTDTVWRIRTAMVTMQTPRAAREELGFIRNAYKFFPNWPILGTMLSGQMDVLIVSIPDTWFDQIQITNEAVLGKEYECGYVVYDGGNTGGITDSEGKPYPFAHFSDGDTVQLGNGSYQIIASHVLSPTNHITRWIEADLYRAILYMPESAFLTKFGEAPSKRCTSDNSSKRCTSVNLTYALLVNAKEGCYDLLRTELEKCSENVTVSIDETTLTRHLTEAEKSGASAPETLSYSANIGGRMDGLEQMKQTVLAIQTVGYSLAAMIFLIGTLNIINTALSSVSERKREFAMLEAVGMTDKQMRRMLLTESLYSSGVAVLLTVCVGFPLISVIIHTAMDGLVSLHWLSGVLMMAVCMMVSIVFGIAVFRMTKSTAVVERIKVE